MLLAVTRRLPGVRGSGRHGERIHVREGGAVERSSTAATVAAVNSGLTVAERAADRVGVSGRSVTIVTDMPVPTIDWWEHRVTVLQPPAGRGWATTVASGWRLIRCAFRHDVVISAHLRNALAVGLMKWLFGATRPRLMMVEMRLDDPRHGLLWRLKIGLQRVGYSKVDVMCVSARKECERYAARLRVPIQRFRFIPWHTNVLDPARHGAKDNVILAAGRTGRDWRTLAEAVRGLGAATVVVCGKEDAAAIPFPEGVSVLADIPYERYFDLLSRARIVLVPLEPHVYSSGQVVFLEAMALGKPIIVTRVLGTEDYITDGVNGLLVEPGDARQLRAAIERVLTDSELEASLAQSAVESVRRLHTLDKYLSALVKLAEELVQPSARR